MGRIKSKHYSKLEEIPKTIFLLKDIRYSKYIGMIGITKPNKVRKLFIREDYRHNGYGMFLSLLAKCYVLYHYGEIPESQILPTNNRMRDFLDKQGMKRGWRCDEDGKDKDGKDDLEFLELDDYRKFGKMLEKYEVPQGWNIENL